MSCFDFDSKKGPAYSNTPTGNEDSRGCGLTVCSLFAVLESQKGHVDLTPVSVPTSQRELDEESGMLASGAGGL